MKIHQPAYRSALLGLGFLIAALFTSLTIYLPGSSGVFLFDDKANILGNSFLKVDSLNYADLKRAALSGNSGPLKRPVASLSFALNYYFSGGHFDARAFKVTNAVIHAVNAFLVFLLAGIILVKQFAPGRGEPMTCFTPRMIAALAAFAWLIHPIQLTSVLYPVQRMTSLAAMFTLLCLLGYLHLRQNFSSRSLAWKSGMVAATLGSFVLALFTKEIAVLIPLFILVLELFCFTDGPVQKFLSAAKSNRLLLLGTAGLAVIACCLILLYAVPGYGNRPFSLAERLLTEPRILFFYLSLIIVPRPNAFGLHHDDIAISTGLMQPWSTLPAILGVALLLIMAVLVKKKSPLISFGISWFLAGHLLESTVFALDITYEHRNYLPSFGIIIAVIGLLKLLLENHKKSILIVAIPVVFVALGSLTWLRSSKWANPASMVYFQVNHHPESARAHAEWAGILESSKQYELAKQHYLVAARLAPDMPAYLIWHQLLIARQGLAPEERLNQDILNRLERWGARPTTVVALADVSNCIPDHCRTIGEPFAQWLDVLIAKEVNNINLSFYHQLQGLYFASNYRPNDAIDAYTQAYNLNKQNITALMSLAWLFISTNQKLAAEHIVGLLQESQRSTGLPKESELVMIQDRVQLIGQSR